MARTKREIAAKLFEAGLFNTPVYATICYNKHRKPDDPRYHYVEIYTAKDVTQSHEMFRTRKMETIFRFFVTMEEWREKIFIPNNGLTAGQALRLIEQYWGKRVCGPNPWGKGEE